MVRFVFALMVAAMFATLGGCSAYHPLRDGEGYIEVPMGPSSYQVSFVGGSSLTVAETREYCLTRAAELAVLHDDPWFHILDEHLYMSYGSEYYPGVYGGGVYYGGRHGRAFYHAGYYEPGYVEMYSIPEVTMRVQLDQQPGPNSIPAAFLIDRAVDEKLKLTPGVVDRAAGMPRTGAAIPPPPAPPAMTQSGINYAPSPPGPVPPG